MPMNKGRFTDEEIAFIKQHVSLLDINEIGENLNRDPTSIKKYITKIGLVPIEPGSIHAAKSPAAEAQPIVRRVEANERVVVSNELRKTEMWKRLADEFEPEELVFLEERYIAMVSQFQDVVATEETQILQIIKLEILMSRNLSQRKKALHSIRFIEQTQKEKLNEYCPNGDISQRTERQLNELLTLQTQLNVCVSDEQSKTTEYEKLGAQHAKLMQSTKATRDQRLDKIESTKVNFLDIVRQLQQRDIQAIEGRQMELMKLAGERELVRLGRPITFEDGNQDSPILCAETVNLGPEEEENVE